MADDMIWVLLARMLERLFAVSIGGLAIYLGFRLFALMPESPLGGANVKLPGGISILVSRVGPGVFFCLFGASITALSLYMAINVPVGPSPAIASPVAILATPSNDGGASRRSAERAEVQRKLGDLDEVTALLPSNLEPSSHVTATKASRAGRIALLQSVWGPDWGDFAAFKEWAQNGSQEIPADEQWARAAAMFKGRSAS